MKISHFIFVKLYALSLANLVELLARWMVWDDHVIIFQTAKTLLPKWKWGSLSQLKELSSANAAV